MRTHAVLSLALLSICASPAAAGDFQISARNSLIVFDGTNLDDANDAQLSSTDLAAGFDQLLAGMATFTDTVGCNNTGSWQIEQFTTLAADRISSDNTQVATTATDCGSPAIASQSLLVVEFTVSTNTFVALDGTIVGSPDSSDADYAHAELRVLPSNEVLFDSALDEFPATVLLSAGNNHEFRVEASGRSLGNAATVSTANASITTLADSDTDGWLDVDDNCILVANPDQRDSDGDRFGNACDPDLDNDCVVGFPDLALMKSVFFTADPDADLDGNGTVSFPDLAVLKASFFLTPGPSGLPNFCDQ